MPDINRRIAEALDRQRAGDAPTAEAMYHGILADVPDHPEALYLLGLARHQQGAHQDALELIRQALPALGNPPEAHFNLSLVQAAAGQHDAAAETLRALIKGGYGGPQVRNALGIALKNAGRLGEAIDELERLCAEVPEFAGGPYNLGNALLAAGRTRDAVAAFDRATQIAPGNPEIRLNLAAALQALGETHQAHSILVHLSRTTPNADVLNNLAVVQRQEGARHVARQNLEQALSLAPSHADAAYNLGALQADLNDVAGAKLSFARAAASRPGFLKAKWAAALTLPQIYPSEDTRLAARADWLKGLDEVASAPVAETDVPAAFAALSEITPFALAYQGEDDRNAMSRWGDLAANIAARALPDLAQPPHPPTRDRKRIGFVSAHFRAHTIERLFAGWLTGLDRSRFEVFLISTSGPGDERTFDLAAKADGRIVSPMGTAELARAVHALGCDVLVYPDIGMDPRTQVLAALRLAPKQAMSWGHPVTSGLPTMDAFLTSAAMEPDTGGAHYREELVSLPGLSVSVARPADPGGTDHPHELFCAQSLFKITPGQDAVFAAIAAETGAPVTFVAHPIPEVTKAFRDRIAAAFRRDGLDPEKTLRFAPPCARDEFLRHLKGSKVVLDTFSWSGGNTSLEALAMGAPVVTLPGHFMRGRHTLAMLRIMGLDDLIAEDRDDYVRIACELCRDASIRNDVRAEIAKTSGRLFEASEPIAALNDFLGGF